MKTQYRIIKRNNPICWIYAIQRKFWFLWFDTNEQPFYCTSLQDCQDKLKDILRREKEFAERKKSGNSVIIKT